MQLMTISQVTKEFGVTTRMLRYYDEIGLLPSIRQMDYSYRMYDEASLIRLRQILILRKLRISLKDISMIFHTENIQKVKSVIKDNINMVEQELEALHHNRRLLEDLLKQLDLDLEIENTLLLFEDSVLENTMSVLLLNNRKKESISMEQFNQANGVLQQLRNVRILYLPPATVAVSHYIGPGPEAEAASMMQDFILQSQLHLKKPDLRMYGYNNPSPQNGEAYGYAFMVTIPEDMEVLPPLEKKTFLGGLYGAHAIKMGDFQEWELLDQWVRTNAEYAYEEREPQGMGGCLEEHLNVYSHFQQQNINGEFSQLDLLIPIKKLEK